MQLAKFEGARKGKSQILNRTVSEEGIGRNYAGSGSSRSPAKAKLGRRTSRRRKLTREKVSGGEYIVRATELLRFHRLVHYGKSRAGKRTA